jgi:hypothetical protein
MFPPFICKFNNLEHALLRCRHFSINMYTCIVEKYIIYLYSLRNREIKPVRGSLFFLFRKLLMINFIFAFNVHIVSIYHLTTLYVFDSLFYINITKEHNNVVMVLEESGSLYLISTLTFLFVVSLLI